jgi:hypothetical protein
MKITKNDGQHCVLSCLESFLYDSGIETSWTDLRDIFRGQDACYDNGTVPNIEAFQKGCEHIGIYTLKLTFEFPAREMNWDESLFIFLNAPAMHCVRLFAQPEETKVLIMDPNFKDESFRYMDLNELLSAKPDYVRVKMKDLNRCKSAVLIKGLNKGVSGVPPNQKC